MGFGGKGIRTPDIQLAKLALYQLSYAPEKFLRRERSRDWPLRAKQKMPERISASGILSQ